MASVGTAFGLNIVEKFVDANGYEIRIEDGSTAGIGSRFSGTSSRMTTWVHGDDNR